MARRTIAASRGCGMAETVTAASAGKVGAGAGPSSAGEKSQEDSHRVKMGGGRRKK